MISFKAFVHAIHDAVSSAYDTLTEKNISIIDTFFVEETPDAKKKEHPLVEKSGGKAERKTLSPRNVILEYPHLDHDGVVQTSEVHVPLITLVPLTTSQIEKATLKAEFEMEIVDGELQLNFTDDNKSSSRKRRSKTKRGELEITIKPQESPEGLKLLVEGYETALKQQIG